MTPTLARADISSPADQKMAGPPPGGSAIALLRFDHERMAFLFADYEQAGSMKEKRHIVEKIVREWRIHSRLEHEVFYPAAREALNEDGLVLGFAAENTAIDTLVGALEHREPGDEAYDAEVRVLGKFIKSHAKEEQGQLFQPVKASAMNLGVVGAQLKQRKRELLADDAPAAPPPLSPRGTPA
ncbi:MAG: hemerythrin domain-containing protein [Burkholderiaceae bacterium]